MSKGIESKRKFIKKRLFPCYHLLAYLIVIFTYLMKSQIRSVKQDIEIRKYALQVKIMNVHDQISIFNIYLYEAYERNDIETRYALIKLIQKKENKLQKLLKDKIEHEHLENSLYI